VRGRRDRAALAGPPVAAQEAAPQPGVVPPDAPSSRSELDELRARLSRLEAELDARREAPPAPPEESPTSAAAVTSQGLILELPLSMSLTVRGQLRVRAEQRSPADYRAPGTFGRPAHLEFTF
jgi:hypothetical protein